jgi:hypothetical protein
MRKYSRIWKTEKYGRRIRHDDPVDIAYGGLWRFPAQVEHFCPTEMDCVLAITNTSNTTGLKYFHHDIREEVIEDLSTTKTAIMFGKKSDEWFRFSRFFYEDELDTVDRNIWVELYPDKEYMKNKVCEYVVNYWVDAYFQ